MATKLREIAILLAITVLPTVFIWLPFFFRVPNVWGVPLPTEGMATIVANYDGPLYLVVAKSLYQADIIKSFPFNLPVEYYSAHFPLFPLLIKLFSIIFGYLYSMLFVTVASSFLAIFYFHKFIQDFVNKNDALWMTAVFAIMPARFLIVRSVGSAEPLFVAAIIASVYYFRKKKYFWAGLWGLVAQLTKSPTILLFAAYFISIFLPDFKTLATAAKTKLFSWSVVKKYSSIAFIPLGLVAVFLFFKVQNGDFLAYFHSGDNIHLFFPPFQIFNYSQPWVGTFWLEEVIFVYLFGLLGITRLIKMKENVLAWFVGIFFVSITFVSHRDIIRYALPIVPFLFAAFAEVITKKEFKIVMLVLAVPIYLFSLAYISQNVMPISDWAPLL
jgi:hypothetical protein